MFAAGCICRGRRSNRHKNTTQTPQYFIIIIIMTDEFDGGSQCELKRWLAIFAKNGYNLWFRFITLKFRNEFFLCILLWDD